MARVAPPEPSMTARTLLSRIRRRGGRIYRMPEVAVFVLTDSRELADWMVSLGGKPYTPPSPDPIEPGAYLRAKGGKREWDIYIHTIPVLGMTTVHQAAKKETLYLVGDDLVEEGVA
jgi:hypothetical protein